MMNDTYNKIYNKYVTMKIVNIPRNTFDSFYRYKRIVLPTTTIAKNGGSTIIADKDMERIAKDIGRSPETILSFLKKKLNVTIFQKGKEILLRKVLTAQEIDDVIDEFIKLHVLCRTCGNPETVNNYCRACGSSA